MKHAVVLVLCGVLSSAVGLSAASSDPQEEKQVMATLERMAQGIVKKDIPSLSKALHEDLTYGHATGHTQTKDELLKDVSNPKRVWEIFKLSKPTVHFYGATAVVRCEADIRNGAPGQRARRPFHVPLHPGQGPSGLAGHGRSTGVPEGQRILIRAGHIAGRRRHLHLVGDGDIPLNTNFWARLFPWSLTSAL